jgi:hypothetical protein
VELVGTAAGPACVIWQWTADYIQSDRGAMHQRLAFVACRPRTGGQPKSNVSERASPACWAYRPAGMLATPTRPADGPQMRLANVQTGTCCMPTCPKIRRCSGSDDIGSGLRNSPQTNCQKCTDRQEAVRAQTQNGRTPAFYSDVVHAAVAEGGGQTRAVRYQHRPLIASTQVCGCGDHQQLTCPRRA